MPVISTKSIPDGIIDRFEKWHNKQIVKRKQKSPIRYKFNFDKQYTYEYYNAYFNQSNETQHSCFREGSTIPRLPVSLRLFQLYLRIPKQETDKDLSEYSGG